MLTDASSVCHAESLQWRPQPGLVMWFCFVRLVNDKGFLKLQCLFEAFASQCNFYVFKVNLSPLPQSSPSRMFLANQQIKFWSDCIFVRSTECSEWSHVVRGNSIKMPSQFSCMNFIDICPCNRCNLNTHIWGWGEVDLLAGCKTISKISGMLTSSLWLRGSRLLTCSYASRYSFLKAWT